jgi:hypothetical protein
MAIAVECSDNNQNGPNIRTVLEYRYTAAISRAMAYSFSCKPAEALAESRTIAR